MSRYHALRVRAVVDETHDTKSLVFEVPPALADAFAYQPGQFLTLRLAIDGHHVPRCYSMSSAPGVDDAPRVTVKRVKDGRGSNWVCDRVRAGDMVEVMPPSGVFYPRSLAGDFLLLAGGSGITPVFAILRSVLARGEGRITLLYANRDEKSVIFKNELKALAEAHPSRLTVIHWLDSVQGVPSVAQLAELARHHRAAQAFICGPGPYMDAAVAALQAMEMPSERIHVERFASLPDEETLAAATAIAQAAPPLPGAVESAVVEVLLDGETHTLHCSGTETLLEAALKAGLKAPYSCQAGMCASCMCQVVEGSVHLRHNDVLDKKDLAKAWTLACQAVPTSERLRIKFPE
ncbi:ferredoxin--NADP reductase [Simplicispira psychrophila]|uniref:ferredoxin--NADP reductase n=1 Tax=Simplicispira psychrophila TaxID=80882 RepID=UPI000483BAF2|nr:ferredoxin--NADP reductase [Simplicispira psychrophila]